MVSVADKFGQAGKVGTKETRARPYLFVKPNKAISGNYCRNIGFAILIKFCNFNKVLINITETN